MHSRDRECAHHHNGEDFALKGKMSIFAVFFFFTKQGFTPPVTGRKKFAKKNKIDYKSLHVHSFGVNILSCTKTDLASSIYPEAIYSTAPPATNYT